MIGASARALVVATVLQGAVAIGLIAHRAVTFTPPTPAGTPGILAGAASGYVLYRLLAARDSAPREYGSVREILLLAVIYVSISLAEEIVWRGWAFGSVANLRGPLVALITTTGGFAVMHGFAHGLRGVRFHVLTGLAFGLTFIATRSLAAAAVAHATYNLAVLLHTVSIRKKACYDRLVVG